MSLRKVLVTASIGILIASSMSGCGDDEDSLSGEKFIADYCTIMASCCETWGSSNDSGARCKEVFGFYAMGSVNQSSADACLSNMRKEQADGTLCEGKPASAQTEDDPCDTALGTTDPEEQNGTIPAGGTCKMSSDCAAPAGGLANCDSVSVEGGYVSYCQQVTPGKEGDGPCTMTIYSNGSTFGYGTAEKVPQTVGCKQADGLYCDSSAKICKKQAANGAPCTGSTECQEGSFCYNWLCAPNFKEGETCDKYVTTCNTGLYCDESTKSCAKLKHIGDACTDGYECTGMSCNDDGTCGAGLAAMAALMFCPM